MDVPVINVQRNIEVFKNAIQMETFKLRSKKLKTLGIKIKKEEGKTAYEQYHNDILEAINELPIVLAEAVLNNFLQAIDAVMQKKKFETKFQDLQIIVKDDEESKPKSN